MAKIQLDSPILSELRNKVLRNNYWRKKLMATKLTNKGGRNCEISLYKDGLMEICLEGINPAGFEDYYAFVDIEELKSVIRMLEEQDG